MLHDDPSDTNGTIPDTGYTLLSEPSHGLLTGLTLSHGWMRGPDTVIPQEVSRLKAPKLPAYLIRYVCP
ncbi:Protein of unknown function [Pyronema omphalodes CBS 100304]|uniref:Uncharacterized protein n=1 Tax=Pyronema omphalodes (strain CBS 100304) TaxID=1076935 RepID=U4LRD2_PYROM|nr:Protein of unknown function [Pyronema omphalodes CBS 100304]